MDTDKLRELCERATAGPWFLSAHDDRDCPTFDVIADAHTFALAEDMLPEDAGFACAARTALPELLADNARLAAELERVRGLLRGLYGTVSCKTTWERRWPHIAALVKAELKEGA